LVEKMRLVGVISRAKPLCFNSSGSLLLAKSSKVYLRSADGEVIFLFTFMESLLNKLLGRFSLWFRLKRLGVMTAISSGDLTFFAYGGKIHRYDLINKELVEEFTFRKGRGPLQFCEIRGISGFSNSICFGEYFGNHDRKEIKIYQRGGDGKWVSPFQFKVGEINHIHALIPDSINECVWILVGDFEHSSAIYMAKDNFQDIEMIVSGKQCYRACVAFPTKEGLLYATDTQIEKNSIRLLSKCKGEWVSKKLYDLNGSCIYGGELKDYYIFSTSTEPCEKPKNKLLRLLDNKPGIGIIENKSDIVSFKKSDHSFEIISSKGKDIFPYRLFQFGTIMFPAGKSKNNVLFSYNVASKKNDLSTEIYSLESN